MKKVAIVAAIGKNRELGKENRLIWAIPEDLKRFKALTTGHPIIMGRKTFESIGKPLPNRTNIVITRDSQWSHEGVEIVHSLEEALEKGSVDENVFVIGGAQIYEVALPHTDVLHLTHIDASADADTFFPEFENQFTKKAFEKTHESNGLKYAWVDWVR